jgi:hypothetical protein
MPMTVRAYSPQRHGEFPEQVGNVLRIEPIEHHLSRPSVVGNTERGIEQDQFFDFLALFLCRHGRDQPALTATQQRDMLALYIG